MRVANASIFALSALALAGAAFAQRLDPIQWTLTSDAARAPAGSPVTLHLKAAFQEGWHLYSLTTPLGGPIPTSAELAENPAIELAKIYQPPPIRKFDGNFNLNKIGRAHV